MTLVDTIRNFFAESGNPVLFAGAGVSARAGLPTWAEYLTTLAGIANDFDFGTKFQMDKKIAEGKFALAASYFFLCDDIPEATRLKELTTPFENYDASKLIDLASLPFASMVTTKF